MNQANNVTKYTFKNSLIHKLDPRFKLLAYLLLISMIFFPTGMTGTVITFSFTLVVLALSRLNIKVLWKTFKPAVIVILLILLINTLVINPAYWGAWLSLIYFLKIWEILILGTILISTTLQSEIAKAFVWMLKPLKVVKFPVEEVSLILTLGIRFIPNIITDASTILKAQRARGLNNKGFNLRNKYIAYKTMMLPLLVSSFSRADEISNSLLARGYKLDTPKTSYIKYKFKWFDFVMLFTVLAFMAFNIYLIIDSGNVIPWFADPIWSLWNT